MPLTLENVNGYTLRTLGTINILMGKNGCGKSTLMRDVEGELTEKDEYNTKYISPERGGSLLYEPNVEHSISQNANWMKKDRRKNQSGNFKQQTVVQYRNLETIVLRAFEENTDNPTFHSVIEKINGLLSNIEIRRKGITFKFYSTEGNEIKPDTISSGESELIALAIECLIFSKECSIEKENILFLDEPDVHLHPDLQVKLMMFLKTLIDESHFRIIISTHSTAMIGAFEEPNECRICFMQNKANDVTFSEITDAYKKILPIFGAHPLSNIFNASPIFIVEGEDDVRIWQQVVRSSERKIKIYPCAADTLDKMSELETDSSQIMNAIYDHAKGFSLRDRDDNPEAIDDQLPIIRFRLSCRNAENLILANETLESMGGNWEEMKSKIEVWLNDEEQKENKNQYFEDVKQFKEGGFDRKNYDLKNIRTNLMYIAQSNKPWEIVIGQAIANSFQEAEALIETEGSLYNFLGRKLVENIFRIAD